MAPEQSTTPIPLDLSERVRWQHRGITWTLAYLPLGKDIELRHAFWDACGPVQEALPVEGDASPEAGARFMAASRAARPALVRVYGELVRWGVAGWNAPGFQATKERVNYAGASHEVLTPEVVSLLGKVDFGRLLEELATRVMSVNKLSQEDLLGFP
jgi:hypothetical protein